MARLQATDLHKQAKTLLDRRQGASRKLVLFHTLIALGVPLLVSVLNLLLNQQIAKTGGLGGMATRSTLATIQSVLQTSVVILTPFWQVGLLYAALRWRRGSDAGKGDLTEGLRRFVNVFALRFWSGVLYVFIGFVIFYISLFIFTATPWAQPIADLISPTGQAVTTEELEQILTPELTNQITLKMLPLFILFGVLFAAVCIPLFYRLRFADFILLEGEGGRRAMVDSMQLTKGRCKQIFKLDLHFWWFYLLQLLSLVVFYGDELLPLMGVTFPWSANVSYFLFYALGTLLQGLLLYWYQDQRLTTFALAYDALQPATLPEEPAPET